MTNTPRSNAFFEESLRFLRFLKQAGQQDNAEWLEKNDDEYQRMIRAPLLALADEAQGCHFPTRGTGRIKKSAAVL